MNTNISFLYEVQKQYYMTFLYEVCRLIPENIETKSLPVNSKRTGAITQ